MSRIPLAKSWQRPGYAIFDCTQPWCKLHVLTPRGEPTPHKCPYYGGQTRMAWMSEGVTLVEQLWKEADHTYELFQECPPEMDARFNFLKGRLRGLCYSLSIFMNPHFKTEDEIGRELVKRGKNGSEYETPGIGARRYEAPPGSPSKYESGQKKAANPGGLTDPQVAAIQAKKGKAPADLLAAGYGVTPAVIEAVWRLSE